MGQMNLRLVIDNTQKEHEKQNNWVVTKHDIFDGRAEIQN